MTLLAVHINGLAMDGTADGDGIIWRATNLPGFWGGPTVESYVSPNGADGEVFTANYRRGRPFMLEGVAIKNGSGPLDTIAYTVSTTLTSTLEPAITAPVTFKVDEPTPKSLTVQLHGTYELKIPVSLSHVEFQIPLLAGDPDKTT